MAFFDNVSKKLTEVSQTAVQKTKNMADVAKLNAQVSDEEKKINEAYLQIGKMYVANHAEDFADEFKPYFELIHASEAKIEASQKELKELRGVEKCSCCGAEVESGSLFCSACGAEMKREEPQESTEQKGCTCPACGATVSELSKFCTSCGTALN